jgi:hypothetical protein
MADYTLFQRLKRLFSTDVIIRNVGGNQLKVVDTNRIQSSGNLATNNLIDRYTKLFNSRVPVSGYAPGEATMIYRKEMFTDYEAMETDSIIASYLDIVADECTTKDEFGDTLTIRSGNPKIQKILQNLFYDILNVEFNLWPWARNLVKYGDFYLRLKLVEKYGVIGVEPVSSFQMIREEGIDPDNKDYVRFKWDPSSMGSRQFVSHTNQQEVFENYEVAHFRMLSDTNFLPYGKSILEPARKVWKQLTLMEDAMLIHRIMRAPEKRVFKIDVGNIPPHEVDTYMQKIINNTKKVPYQDPQTGDYNLKFNMQNMIEDFYIPVRGAESGTAIDTTKGLDYDGITDVEYLKNRMLAALRVPKAFLNYEEGLSGKATLAAEDIRFSRTIERIQRIIISELYKIAIVHLYIQGFEDADLIEFEISMTAPSTIYEKEKIELWQSKVNLAKDMMDAGLASQDWIYKNLFNLPEEEYGDQRAKVLDDAKYIFRREQIKSEGNDPVKTGKSFGTAHDIASLYKGDGGVPDGYDENIPKKDVANAIKPKLGRPSKNTTYGTHEHPLGYDPLGAKEASKAAKISDSIQKITNGIKRKSVEILKETYSSENTAKNKKITLLDETNIIDSEDII